MKRSLVLFSLTTLCVFSSAETVRRGNLFQQLMFLTGVPLNEMFYRTVLNILYLLNRLVIRLVNPLYPEGTNCTHDTFCARTGYCSSVCKEGTVSVSPWMSFASRTQSSLSLLGSMCSHQSIGTHNSAITASYGFGVEDCLYSMVLSASYLQFNEVRTLSQYFSLTDQLNLGVRHLELDIHYFHGQFRMSHCGFSIGIINYLFHFMEDVLKWLNFKYDTDTIGCLPSFNGIPAGGEW